MKKTTIFGIFTIVFGFAAASIFYTNCSNSSGSSGNSNSGSGVVTTDTAPNYSSPLPITAGQANVMTVTVGCGYVNEPCVTVTICAPGTNNCQTIPNVLLDTGSFGLRLFNNVTSDWRTTTPLISLPAMADPANNSNTLAECVSYGDGSSDWGTLATADVQLGQELASGVPVQIINSSYGTVPSGCDNLDTDPISSGFNGILGVGVFAQDCGESCVGSSNAANGQYFSCTSSGVCTGTAVALANQVANPIVFLPTDNNGGVLALTNTAAATSLQGYFVLGIGTQTNNSPAGTTVFLTDANGNFQTSFGGITSTSSFIDSGSNGLYFPQPSGLPVCTDDSSFYCPTAELGYTATQVGAGGSPTNSISFFVGNADNELAQSNSNIVFNDLSGPYSDFDWGLPFFLGRNIFVGIQSQPSSIGTGPYWSY